MPLEVLGIMVVLGLAIAIGAVHFSGLSHAASLDNPAQAERRYRQDFPESEVGASLVTQDRSSAFLKLSDGGIGLVTVMGDRYITRQIDAQAVADLERQGETGLSLHFHDFTYPAGTYLFADADEANRLAGWFEELKQ